MKRNYKVTLTRVSTITVYAYDEEDAKEIADQTPLKDLEWVEKSIEYDVEEDYEEDDHDRD